MNRLIIMIPVVALLTSACGNYGTAGRLGSKIKLNVSAERATRNETTVTTTSLSIFKMMAISGEYIDHTISSTETVKPADGIYFNSYVKKTNGNWDIYDGESDTVAVEKYWINSNPMGFWSYYPFGSGVAGTLNVETPAVASSKLFFTYALPTHTDGSDATNQQDLVFAGNVETRDFDGTSGEITGHTSTNGNYNRNDNELDIVFHHPLSKIQFAVKIDDGTFDKTLKIKKIEIANIYGKGKCRFTAPATFYWDEHSLSSTYSQSYNGDFTLSTTGSDNAPTGWPYYTVYNEKTVNMNIASNCFFLIPQEVGGKVINVTFNHNGSDIVKSVTLPATTAWEADHYYIYKISAHAQSEDIQMSVSLYDWAEREDYIPID